MNFCECPVYYGKKKFGPGFFLQMLNPKQISCTLFWPYWATIWENGFSLLCDVISVFHSSMKQALQSSEWLQNQSFFFLYKAMPYSGSFLLLHPKAIHESGILWKKKAISLCLCLFCAWMKLWDEITWLTRPILLYCSPKLGQKSTQLPYFEKVQGKRKKGNIFLVF